MGMLPIQWDTAQLQSRVARRRVVVSIDAAWRLPARRGRIRSALREDGLEAAVALGLAAQGDAGLGVGAVRDIRLDLWGFWSGIRVRRSPRGVVKRRSRRDRQKWRYSG